MPWEFSEAPEPGESAYPNLPTPEGRALGAELARLADVAEAENRERFPRAARRCYDCAFRAGTDPNGCAETLMDALKCVVEAKPFFCHKGVAEGDTPRTLCAGFALLMRADGAA